MSVYQCSPLDTLDRAFGLLVTGPDPLALDGSQIEGLPSRLIPLDELRSMLLHPSTSFGTRDAAMRLVVRHAQAGSARWRVGLAGVLLPGLRRMAGRATRDYPGDAADIDAEILAGLLETLDGFDAKEAVAKLGGWGDGGQSQSPRMGQIGVSRAVRRPQRGLACSCEGRDGPWAGWGAMSWHAKGPGDAGRAVETVFEFAFA